MVQTVKPQPVTDQVCYVARAIRINDEPLEVGTEITLPIQLFIELQAAGRVALKPVVKAVQESAPEVAAALKPVVKAAKAANKPDAAAADPAA